MKITWPTAKGSVGRLVESEILKEISGRKRSTEQSHLNTNPRDMKLIFWDVYNTGKELGVHTPYLDKLQFRLRID